jgi:uncharacterized protein with PQ loop repeat
MSNKSKEDKFGLTSLILGIISMMFMLFGLFVSLFGFIGFIFMILTFIFSGIQLKRSKNNLAVSGLIFGFIALGIFMLDSVLTAKAQKEYSNNELDNKINQIINCDVPVSVAVKLNCEIDCGKKCSEEGFHYTDAKVNFISNGICHCTCMGCKQ